MGFEVKGEGFREVGKSQIMKDTENFVKFSLNPEDIKIEVLF
jgi:hypothetical protein